MLFLAPKIKYCLTIDEYGVIEEHITFMGLTDSKRLLDRSQCLKMLKDKTIYAKLPSSWNKSYHSGIVIPKKKTFLYGM